MILTLCGSARFEPLFKEWNEKLTLAGHVIFSLAVYPSDKSGQHEWYNEEQKIALDLAHLGKIDASQGIVVLNKDGYAGFSTKREIQWAYMKGKKIYMLERRQEPWLTINLFYIGSVDQLLTGRIA